jgi:F-type H+-transporting ATPase subunit b
MHTSQLIASGAVNLDLDATAIAQFLLFTAFVVLMKDVIFDPLLKVFDERERRTAGAIDDARDLDEKAIALKGQYDARVEEVRRDAAIDRDRLRAKMKQIESEMTDASRSAATEKLENGLGILGREAAAVRKDLDAQQAALASQIASRVLGREVRS